MSLPKKGCRSLLIGDEIYSWYIRRKPTYIQGVFNGNWTMAVELDGFKGAILLVRFNLSRPDNWLSPHQTGVTPSLVKQIIHHALASGWRPKLPGSAFLLDYSLICDTVNGVNPTN